MCKSGHTCDTSSSTKGSGATNMTTIIVRDSDGNNTPSSTPTSTAGPQQQSHRNCNGKEDNISGNTDGPTDEDLNRSMKSGRKSGLVIVQSTKIRSILAMIVVVVGALIHARLIPESLYDHMRLTKTSSTNNYDEGAAKTTSSSLSPFMIIIDGGSTGSRLHVFEFVVMTEENEIDNNSTQLSTTTIVERRGSFRTISPLSTFITTNYEYMKKNEDGGDRRSDDDYFVNQTDLKVNHIVPLLQYIERTIPARYISTTPIYYAATAGMRLLTVSQQNLIYDSFIQIVMDYCQEHEPMNKKGHFDRHCFHLPRHHIQTLSGELEGYYGVLAANYLHGKIDTNLHVVVHNSNNDIGSDSTQTTSDTVDVDNSVLSTDETIAGVNGTNTSSKSITGALDMGGSSTQIVFYTAHDPYGGEADYEVCINNDRVGSTTLPKKRKKKQLHERHFFSMSYLSYGVDQFRDRLWNLLVYDKGKSDEALQQEKSANKIVMNPCSNPGHNVTATINGTAYLLVGIGNVVVCKEYMKRIIPHPIQTPIHHIYDDSLRSTSMNSNKVVGGIQHPSIYNESPSLQQEQDINTSSLGDDGSQSPDFLAMSLYFFTFDSIRVFTNDPIVNERWPKPTLLELENATSQYCTMNLVDDIYPLYDMDPQNQPHPYTRKGIVQHRCMEAIYMISLLETFGFTSHERHITFAFDVNGSEVEWTLGMALQYYANNNNNTEQDQNSCPWDSLSGNAFSNHDSVMLSKSSSQGSIVQRIRNYFSQSLFPDDNNNAKSTVSNE